MVCQRADEERYGRLAPGARVVTGPTALSHRSARLAWEQSGLPLVAQQVDADVIHVPYYSMPLRPGRPTVVTVHDVTFFTEPELYSPVSAMFFKSAIRTAARRAARLIVPSKATRDELERVLGADPTKIDVAYHGVDHQLFHRPDPEQVAAGVQPAGPARQAVRRVPRQARPAQERGRADHRLGRRGGRPRRPARPGAGRRRRLERRGGHRRRRRCRTTCA